MFRQQLGVAPGGIVGQLQYKDGQIRIGVSNGSDRLVQCLVEKVNTLTSQSNPLFKVLVGPLQSWVNVLPLMSPRLDITTATLAVLSGESVNLVRLSCDGTVVTELHLPAGKL